MTNAHEPIGEIASALEDLDRILADPDVEDRAEAMDHVQTIRKALEALSPSAPSQQPEKTADDAPIGLSCDPADAWAMGYNAAMTEVYAVSSSAPVERPPSDADALNGARRHAFQTGWSQRTRNVLGVDPDGMEAKTKAYLAQFPAATQEERADAPPSTLTLCPSCRGPAHLVADAAYAEAPVDVWQCAVCERTFSTLAQPSPETPATTFERTPHPGMDEPEPDYFARSKGQVGR